MATLATRFYALLWDARRIHQRDLDAEEAGSIEATGARMNLGGLTDEMKAEIKELESRVRSEMKA